MSTQCCHKAFQLVVNPGVPAPSAYFHLEGDVGGELVDEIAGRNFTIGAPGTFSAGKKDNGWTGGSVASPATTADTFYNVNAVTNGFTLRLWLMMPAIPAAGNYEYPIYIGAQYRVWVWNNGTVHFQLNRSTGAWIDSFVTLPNPGIWYHIMCYWDKTGNVIGIKLNNGAAVTTAFTYTLNTPGGSKAMGTTQAAYGMFDELSFWKDRVLTPSEMTMDYNGGFGQFWPW